MERGTAWGGCDCTGIVTEKPTPTVTETPTFEPPQCETNGQGAADEGTKCAFPFTENGVVHYKCVGTGYGGEGYCLNGDGLKGGCKCSATLAPTSSPFSGPKCVTNGRGAAPAGSQCVFPFAFKGDMHYACIGETHGGEGFCIINGKKGGCKCEETEIPSEAPSVTPATLAQPECQAPHWIPSAPSDLSVYYEWLRRCA